MFIVGRFCRLRWHENLPNLQVRTISGSENLDFILVPLLLLLWFRELELQPRSPTTTTLGVQRTWSVSVFGSISALRGSENLGLARAPLDLSILVGAENLGFAVVPMAILSARFVERGGFHQRSRHLLGTLSSCAARYVWVVIIGLPITSQHLSNQTLVQPRVG
jgi:hypothetical protein